MDEGRGAGDWDSNILESVITKSIDILKSVLYTFPKECFLPGQKPLLLEFILLLVFFVQSGPFRIIAGCSREMLSPYTFHVSLLRALSS